MRSCNNARISLCTLFRSATGCLATDIVAVALAPSAFALPSFAQQTGQPCSTCHVGAFGPQLTPFDRSFKLGGYTSGMLFESGAASVQYTIYDKFNGASSNYDGFRRSAHDNNTLFLFLWTAI